MKFLTLMVLALIPVGWSVGKASGTAPRFEPTVVVVDMPRLMAEHPDALQEHSELIAWRDRSQGLLDEKLQQIKSATADLDALQPGSPDHRKAEEELMVMKYRYEQETKSLGAELEQRYAGVIRRSYERAQRACREYRVAHGISLVLQRTSTPVSGQTRDELIGEIVLRKVVAYDDALDITEEVIATFTAGGN